MMHMSLQEAIVGVRSMHFDCCPPAKEEMIIKQWIDHCRQVYKTEHEGDYELGGEG